MAGRFWEFEQLQDDWKGQSHFDHVPKAGKLYIGGLSALYKEPDPLQKAGITHVLSVLDFDTRDARQLSNYQRLFIRVEDTAEDDLLKHFPETCRFIEQALDAEGGGVFVHCAMGVSRSATVVIAYLMWKSGIGLTEAWGKLREARKRVRPNEGFLQQLKVWERMVREKGGWDQGMYERWKAEGRGDESVKSERDAHEEWNVEGRKGEGKKWESGKKGRL